MGLKLFGYVITVPDRRSSQTDGWTDGRTDRRHAIS